MKDKFPLFLKLLDDDNLSILIPWHQVRRIEGRTKHRMWGRVITLDGNQYKIDMNVDDVVVRILKAAGEGEVLDELPEVR